MFRILALPLTLLAFATPAFAGPLSPGPIETLRDSSEVLTELHGLKLKGIPPALLSEAQGVAIIPHVVKAGFIVGGRGGHGVVLVRTPEGSWGEPTFVHIGGASVGLQVGVQATDVVLVFRSRKSLNRILEGKGKLTLGADAAIAAGPVGRQAEAATDARLKAEILSYSRSRGLFAGVAFEGAVLSNDHDTNRAYRAEHPEAVKYADALRLKLAEMSGDKIVLPAAPPPPTVVLPPPTVPAPPPPVPVPPPPRVPPATIPDRPQ